MKKLVLFSVVFLLFISCTFTNTEIEGEVVSVSDGDTFTLLTPNKNQVKVRVYGVDCPERGQPFGKKAKQFTSDLVYKKYVYIEEQGTDQYNRVLGVVTTINGENLNEELLRNGYAWHYKRYCGWETYSLLEEEAQKNKVGLWADESPIPPWEFRRNKSKQ